ncbi:MAG: hypothetical protein ACOVQ2_10185, partial [Flavobacterium sp.]
MLLKNNQACLLYYSLKSKPKKAQEEIHLLALFSLLVIGFYKNNYKPFLINFVTTLDDAVSKD